MESFLAISAVRMEGSKEEILIDKQNNLIEILNPDGGTGIHKSLKSSQRKLYGFNSRSGYSLC